MDNKKYIVLGVIVLALGGVVLYGQLAKSSTDVVVVEKSNTASIITGQKATVYKSPNCGCCVGYVKKLEDNGVEVEVVETEDMDSIKQQYDIPSDMQSCHTIVMGDYFIEGHVPLEAVEKLLTEKPNIDGIALPGMPSGTPGMPGVKRAPFSVYQLTEGDSSEFVTL